MFVVLMILVDNLNAGGHFDWGSVSPGIRVFNPMRQFLSSGLDQSERSIANGARASRNTPFIDKPGLNSAKNVVLSE